MKYQAVALLRVSSTKQGLQGDSPDDQKVQIIIKASTFNILPEQIKFFKLIQSASGEIQPAQDVIDFCKTNQVEYCFIKSIDRFTRGGADFYPYLKNQLIKVGVQLVDVFGVINPTEVNTLEHLGMSFKWSKYHPSYTSELLEAERAKSEVRDILSRLIGAEIRYIRMGYWVGPPPQGLVTDKIETDFDGKRTILSPDPKRSIFFKRMFELRAQGNLTDHEIVTAINEMGYKSPERRRRKSKHDPTVIGIIGGTPLTCKQMRNFIENPIYAGIIVHGFSQFKPVKAKFEGLVSVGTWNKANRGRATIVTDGDTIRILRQEPESWQLTKQKQNPEFPYREFVLCSECKHPLKGSFSTGKLGKKYPGYHCSLRHKLYRIPRKDFDKTIEKFVSEVKFSDRFKLYLKKYALEEMEKRRMLAVDDSLHFQQLTANLTAEKKLILEKVKILSNPLMLKELEKQLEDVEAKLIQAKQKRNNKEEAEVQIDTLIAHANYYMEHLKELLFSGTNPIRDAEFFSLLFEELPTYKELEDGTPKLDCLFRLNEAFNTPQSDVVSGQGLEP